MTKETQVQDHRIDQFFSGPGGRADDWRDLVEAAKAWARGAAIARNMMPLLTDLVGDGGVSRLSRPAIDGGPEGSAAAGDAATSLALCDPDHPGADDAVVPSARRRLECER